MKNKIKVREALKRLRMVYPFLKYKTERAKSKKYGSCRKIICINKMGYKTFVCLVINGLVDTEYLSPEVLYYKVDKDED